MARALERAPEDRFADAAAMEQALAAALRGVAPEPTSATRALEDTDATRMLDRTSVTTPLARTQAAPARRRRMEPIAEPPRRSKPRRPARARPRAGRRRRPGGALRMVRNLLALALIAAVARRRLRAS